ncbi:MAG: prephenate/arogenate dehydrogenase family protein [Nisaea sp.]|uniref:prephenate/arogenate dehydrogenase family protein n=1 Tax=Nisaea sp. TaxID=2024842 RepID=UPI001B1EC76B|nr:prephenate/arogenate dehydrogenase family protein [Nisaea sp.]MBO6559817.1 prephenate/arogenate dehydrogenase family protein [Nisaea sp.]
MSESDFPKDKPVFRRLAVIGCGNIGSSVVRAVRAAGNGAAHVAVFDPDPAVRARVRELGIADSVHDGIVEVVEGADCVVLCSPVRTYGAITREIAPHLARGAVLTDVGSVKMAVVKDVAPEVPDGVHFVPGHPVAGTEKSGPDAGFAELFQGRYWLLTPEQGTDEGAVSRLVELWSRVGAIVEVMDAAYHDKVLALTSHLPHLIAYTIVGTAFDVEEQERQDVIRFSAGGFRDFTRIAGSDPTMWRDIFLTNKDAVLEMLQRFNEDLTALQRQIRYGEGDKLFDFFTRTRDVRRSVVEAHQAGSNPWGPGANGDHPASETGKPK